MPRAVAERLTLVLLDSVPDDVELRVPRAETVIDAVLVPERDWRSDPETVLLMETDGVVVCDRLRTGVADVDGDLDGDPDTLRDMTVVRDPVDEPLDDGWLDRETLVVMVRATVVVCVALCTAVSLALATALVVWARDGSAGRVMDAVPVGFPDRDPLAVCERDARLDAVVDRIGGFDRVVIAVPETVRDPATVRLADADADTERLTRLLPDTVDVAELLREPRAEGDREDVVDCVGVPRPLREGVADAELDRDELVLRLELPDAVFVFDTVVVADSVVLAAADLDREADAVIVLVTVLVLEVVAEPVAVLLLVDVRDPTALDVELFEVVVVRVEVSVFTGDAVGRDVSVDRSDA